MQRLIKPRMPCRARREPFKDCGWHAYGLRALLIGTTLVLTMMLSACGGSASSNSQPSTNLSGNWQFTMSPQTDPNQTGPTFTGGVQGGFLLQQSLGLVTGQAVYSVTSSASTTGLPCNAGSAAITQGKISGQTVNLTFSAGSQTFTLMNGTLSADGSTIMGGTYRSTVASGTSCGYATTGSWSAFSVPSITGPIQGSFHSTGGSAGLGNQDFAVTGSLVQGENIGASNATVTGTLTFVDPTTELSNYPCFSVASVNGQISGNSVILQIIGTDGSIVGQIGEPAISFGSTGVNPVTFDSVHGGYILHGTEPTYLVATKACKGSLGNTVTAGDFGNICLGLGSASACQQPITLTPAVITFPGQILESAAMTQTITLTNNSSSTLTGLTVNFINNGDFQFGGQSDFNGLPSLAKEDTCASPTGSTFSLAAGQSCSITLIFSPQESCPWLPFPQPGNGQSITGASPEYCPFPQGAQVTVNVPASEGSDICVFGSSMLDCSFAVPVTGIGLSAIQPSTPELDFGAEEQLSPPEASLPQMLSFTNNSGSPLQILGRASCSNPPKGQLTLPHPLQQTSRVAGLQVVSNGSGGILPITPAGSTITYNCDSDPGTKLPNFQISSDTCTGTLLAPQASCSLQVTYVPQPNTSINSGLDYFLELNTVQCSDTVTSDCEIDSGRFPVELKANSPSPLRMSPGAGLDFGSQAMGKSSGPLTITLLNDQSLSNPQTVTFAGKVVVQGNYSETDDCPVTLAPGSSCTLTVTFKPSIVGFDPGTITINYSPEPAGAPQVIYLRGTGQ